MINIGKLTQFLKGLNSQSLDKDIVTNAFLANCQSQVLLSLTPRYQECSILSTLFNDSLYIIKLNFGKDQEEQDKNQNIQMVFDIERQTVFIFNIENSFIYGVFVKKQHIDKGRQIAVKSCRHMRKQLKEVMKWMLIDAQNN